MCRHRNFSGLTDIHVHNHVIAWMKQEKKIALAYLGDGNLSDCAFYISGWHATEREQELLLKKSRK
jgi:hypothetical protein